MIVLTIQQKHSKLTDKQKSIKFFFVFIQFLLDGLVLFQLIIIN